MKSAISKLNQSGLQLDDEAVRTIQAASRPDWNPHEQLVLVTIPDVSSQSASIAQRTTQSASAVRSELSSPIERLSSFAFPSSDAAILSNTPSTSVRLDSAEVKPAAGAAPTPPSPQSIASTVEAPAPSSAKLVEPTQSPTPTTTTVAPPTMKSHSAIVESLLARFASESSCLIHFCDTDQPRRAAEVCLSVGMEFAEKVQRRVLLVDTSRTSRPLSSLLGVDLAAGFREVLRTELNWRHLVRQTSHPLVDILPAGVIKLSTTATRADFEFQMRKLIGELSVQYGGIFCSADTAFDLESELIGLCCDGGFLTMDFHRTSRGLAKSAANHMRASGTRLLGCIAAAINNQQA